MQKVFKIEVKGKRSKCYYGKVKEGDTWSNRIKLFSDKVASERRLKELQTLADRRTAGVITADSERLVLPIKELAKQYHEALRLQRRDAEHIRISEWTLAKLVELCGWRFYRDITGESLGKAIATLAAQGKTPAYQNKFITRAKAFVHWLLPDGYADPLAKVGRVKLRGGKQTRARRVATAEEAGVFFKLWPSLPDSRHLSYALAMLNGLRRNEIAGLRWDQITLNAPIPFVKLAQKQGDGRDFIPLHPYVVGLLQSRMAMPEAKAVSATPDMKTMAKDLLNAGVATLAKGKDGISVGKGRYVNIANGQGERLDFHALRHTFKSRLDQSGASRATVKKLMRHAAEDVTDGYGKAELAEMYAALCRVPSPSSLPQVAVKTGTDDTPLQEASAKVDQQVDQGLTMLGHCQSLLDTVGTAGVLLVKKARLSENPWKTKGFVAELKKQTRAANIPAFVRPSTQVD